MRKILLILFSVCWFGGASAASDLIPLESFAKHAKYQSVQISPTGEYLAFSSLEEGKRVITILRRSPTEVLNVVKFSGNEQAGDFFWANDERLIISIQRTRGALAAPFSTGELYGINYDGSRGSIIFGYRSEGGMVVNPLIEAPRVMDMLWEDDKYILLQGLPVNSDSSNLTNVYRLNIYSGKKRKITSSPIKQASMLADSDQQVRFAVGMSDTNGKNKIQVYYREDNSDDWELQAEFDSDGSASTLPLSFTSDDKGIYMLSSHENGKAGIYRYDIKTEQLTKVYQHERVDISSYDLSRENMLTAVHIAPDYNYTEVIEPKHPMVKWYPSIIKAFGGATVRITSATEDYSLLTLIVRSDRNPGSFYLFDTKKGKIEPLAQAKPWLDEKQIAEIYPVAIQTRDGYTNYAYLSTPVGKEKNLPLVMIPHGGPHGPRDYWEYDDYASVFTSRGYAVLKVNFRGSGGYGIEHEKAGYGEWGGLMIDDMTDAVRWAIKDGVADPDRICIFGGSYGGYAAVMSVVKEPDLYKCAIGYVGIYDMELMFEEGDVADRRSGQNYLTQVLTKDEAKLDEFSPARHVDKIKADLFIVHGEEDVRAHYEHALLLREKLDEAGKPYQWLTKEKEGHGFYTEENRLELFDAMLKFLDKNIGDK